MNNNNPCFNEQEQEQVVLVVEDDEDGAEGEETHEPHEAEHAVVVQERALVPNNNNTNSSSNDDKEVPARLLQRIPNTAFGIGLGLAGNAILWKTISDLFFESSNDLINTANTVLWILALAAGLSVGVCYLYKCLYHRHLVSQELKHPTRIHYMNVPHLLLIMLTISVPHDFHASIKVLRILFGIGGVAQIVSTQHVYNNWLFHSQCTISLATPPFLLSTVGWFLLANLGLSVTIEDAWGLALPQFCLGIGTMFYLVLVFTIMTSLHEHQQELKGSPSLTLLMAPPSVAVIVIDALNGTPDQFSDTAAMVLGWILILLVPFAKSGPVIKRSPRVLGEYWAYVFPLAAAATAFIRYASKVQTMASKIIASIYIAIASLAIIIVACRMLYHTVQCMLCKAQWGDPLLNISPCITTPPPLPTTTTTTTDIVEQSVGERRIGKNDDHNDMA